MYIPLCYYSAKSFMLCRHSSGIYVQKQHCNLKLKINWHTCSHVHLLNLLALFLYIGMPFQLHVTWHVSYLQVTCENQWITHEYGACECQVKIEQYRNMWLNLQKGSYAYIRCFKFIRIYNSDCIKPTAWILGRDTYLSLHFYKRNLLHNSLLTHKIMPFQSC